MIQRGARQVDPEKLKMLAKRASDLHLGGSMTLTDAVVNTVRDEPDLGSEHVRRVVEIANNETFQRMFSKEAADHRVINFRGGPADPSAVLKELNMGAVPSATAISDRSFDMDPYVAGADSMGDPFDTSKTASANYPMADPLSDVWEQRERLNGLREHFESEFVGAMARYDDAMTEMCKQARQVVLSGGTTPDIARVVSHFADSPDMAKLALRHIESSVGVTPQRNLNKVASIPNPSHPLATAFRAFQKVAMDRFRLAAAIERVEDALSVVRSDIKARLG